MLDEVINKIADKVKSNQKPCDYKNADGILICGICNSPKQLRIKMPITGQIRIVNATCKCGEKDWEEQRTRMKRQRFEIEVERLQQIGVTDKKYLTYTFENDDLRNPKITDKCKKYIKEWEQMKKNNMGMLFYGDVGVGKSFLACCIGNALIKQGVPVLITNLSKLVKLRTENNGINNIDINNYDLLIIDDLGIENATQTAYNIIDDRYRSDKPLIITTNLTPNELKCPDNMDKKRIYDRVIEMCCIPIPITSEPKRYKTAKEKREKAEKILNG